MIILCQSKLQCLHCFVYHGIYNPESETSLKFESPTPVSISGLHCIKLLNTAENFNINFIMMELYTLFITSVSFYSNET